MNVSFDKTKVLKVYLRKIAMMGVLLGVISFIIVQGLIRYSAISDENEKVDYLVILGAGLWDSQPSPTLRRRLEKGIEYLNNHPGSKVVVSGGLGANEEISEAEAMMVFLMGSGIEEERIIREDRSTNSFENLTFTKEILDSLYDGQGVNEIIIVTSEFHLFRTKMLARRIGFSPYGIPAETPSSVSTKYAIREYFAIIKSFLFDR